MADNTYFLCFDAGTTRFKTALINQNGTIVGKSNYYYKSKIQITERYHIYTHEDFSNALTYSLSSVKDFIKSRSITSIGITGHGPMLLPVEKNGNPLSYGIGYLDERIKNYIIEAKKIDANSLTASMYIPIALFYKNELPEVYAHTASFFQSYDYISFLLTQKAVTTVSSPWILPWNKALLKKFGLDPAKFPPIHYMGTEIGHVSAKAEKQYVLPRDIPVIAMGGDFAMALAGSGAIKNGAAYDRTGSSGGLNLCWHKNILDKRLLSYRHFIEGFWNIAGLTTTAGKAVSWAQKILGIDKLPHFTGKKASTIFFPYLKGERTPLWNPFARAMFLGIQQGNSPDDLLFSVFAGITLSIRDCMELMEQNNCNFTYPIVATGWLSQFDWFLQLKADITGKVYTIAQTEDAELLGIAVLLAVSTGIYTDITQATSHMVHTGSLYTPSEKNYRYYSELYRIYQSVRKQFYTQ